MRYVTTSYVLGDTWKGARRRRIFECAGVFCVKIQKEYWPVEQRYAGAWFFKY